MKNIQNLPDIGLLKIFDRVPLEDLVARAALVCRRWHWLVLRSIYVGIPSALARRRKLILVITEGGEGIPSLGDPRNVMRVNVGENAPEQALVDLFQWIADSFVSLNSLFILYAAYLDRNGDMFGEELLQRKAPRPILDLISSLT